MKPLLKLFFCVLILFSFNSFSSAETKGITINADSTSYDKDKGIIEASGSVEAKYKDVVIRAASLTYYTKESKVFARDGFDLSKKNMDLRGDKLFYSLKTEYGTAENIVIASGSTKIIGRAVFITPDRVIINDATFSSCDLALPHYKVSSSAMTYYMNSGWLTEYLGVFWINGIPVFPVPTYVYDTGLAGPYRKENPAPLPDIGSNQYEGTFLKERIVWHISGFSYGMAKFELSSKKGLGLGFEGNYVANDNNEGNARIETLGSDGYFGGITHTFYFGDDVPREKMRQLLYEVLQVPPRKKYDLSIDISYRELKNYERVSLLPKLTLRYIDVPFPFLNFKPQVEFFASSISEESTGLSLVNIGLKSSFDYLQPVSGDSDLRTGLDLAYSSYASQASWSYLLGRLDFKKTLYEGVGLTAGYSHYFVNDGASPFRYENYFYFPSDNIRFGASYKLGYSSLGVLFSYNSPLLTVRDIDYNAVIGMHCFDISLTWRAARGEALFGVTLASR